MINCRSGFRLYNAGSPLLRSFGRFPASRQSAFGARGVSNVLRPPRRQHTLDRACIRPSNFSQVRLQSTSQNVSTSSLPSNSSPPYAEVTSAGSLSFDEPILALTDHTHEHYIGYLKDLGIDFGWGTSSLMQYIFEHIHVYSGAPYWGSILLLAFGYRLCILPLLVKSSDTGNRLRAIIAITKPITEKMKAATAAGDHAASNSARMEIMQSYRSAGIKMRRMVYPFLQVPFGFGTWRLLRNMSTLPVPGMATGGTLWFQNLTVPDPYFVLPIAMGACMFAQFRLGGESGVDAIGQNKMITNVFKWVMPFLIPVLVMAIPAGVQLSFAINAVFGLGTAWLIRRNWFRNTMGVMPMVEQRPIKAEEPLERIRLVGKNAPNSPNHNDSSPLGFVGKQWKSVKTGYEGIKKQGVSNYTAMTGKDPKSSVYAQKQKAKEYEKKVALTTKERQARYEDDLRESSQRNRQKR